MHRFVGSIALAITILALASAAGEVLADAEHSPGPHRGMMGDMGGGGMMRGMMQGCGAMMQGGSRSGRPNEQWREDRRPTPDRHE